MCVEDASRLELSVLGDLTVRRDQVQLELGGRRQRAVLALLVIARGEVVSAERLMDQLWNGSAPPNALGALQSYISHLRRRLEPDVSARARGGVIVSSGSGYAVRLAPDAVDAWRFERLLRESASCPRRAGTRSAPDCAAALARPGLRRPPR